MIVLRVPNRNVAPADFPGRYGVCQNLSCLAPVEPPYQGVRLSLPGGSLETVLCQRCLPRPWDGPAPEMRLEVVDAAVVLTPPDRSAAAPGSEFRLLCTAELLLPPPPVGPGGPAENAPPAPTFRALARLEPRLRGLLAEARSYRRDRGPVFCANAVWYGYSDHRPGLKDRLCRLVGLQAERGGALASSAAYDVAYETIYRALPDCRGRCACSVIWGI
jgi:hypothetical protein